MGEISQAAEKRLDKEVELNALSHRWMKAAEALNKVNHPDPERLEAVGHLINALIALADIRGRLAEDGKDLFPLHSLDRPLEPMTDYIDEVLFMVNKGVYSPFDNYILETWTMKYVKPLKVHGRRVTVFDMDKYGEAILFTQQNITSALTVVEDLRRVMFP